jgi:hypothetical protein
VVIGENEFRATPGTYILQSRGVPHTLWNPESQPARILEIICPVGLRGTSTKWPRYSRRRSEDRPTSAGWQKSLRSMGWRCTLSGCRRSHRSTGWSSGSAVAGRHTARRRASKSSFVASFCWVMLFLLSCEDHAASGSLRSTAGFSSVARRVAPRIALATTPGAKSAVGGFSMWKTSRKV